jgi:choice-of-anchor C domain-containing protein
MRWCHVFVAALLVCAAGSSVRADSIVVNGSFETPVLGVGFTTYGAGNSALTPWVIASGSIDHIDTLWQAAEGSQSLDMNGNGTAGSIYQDLDTMPGQAYTLSFAQAANPDGLPAIKTLRVEWDGALVADVNSTTVGKTRANMGWETHSFTVVASGTTTRLQFTSQTSGFFGPALDDVRVEGVPLPGTAAAALALLGGVGLLRRGR